MWTAIDMTGLKHLGNFQESSHGAGRKTEDREIHRKTEPSIPTEQTLGGNTFGLTEIVARLKQFEQSILQQSVVDPQRVAGVQRALNNGAYSIDVERVAGKMIAFERELGDEE